MGRITDKDLTPQQRDDLKLLQDSWLALGPEVQARIDKRMSELIKEQNHG